MNALYKKLSLDKFDVITILNEPDNYELFKDLDVNNELMKNQDCLIRFVYSLKEIKETILNAAKNDLINDKGYLYLAYPKLNNRLGLDSIHRDDIFPYLNLEMQGDGFVDETNLKFSRMVKLDDNFTIIGLRQFDKRPKIKEEVSQRVDDYVRFIPNIVQEIKNDQITLDYFNALSPYRQKDLARHIFSAKKDETKQKRWEKLREDARNS